MLFMGFLSSATLEQQPQALGSQSDTFPGTVADLIGSEERDQPRVQGTGTWHSGMTRKGSFDHLEGANRGR